LISGIDRTDTHALREAYTEERENSLWPKRKSREPIWWNARGMLEEMEKKEEKKSVISVQ
jgi:hypothetical protein